MKKLLPRDQGDIAFPKINEYLKMFEYWYSNIFKYSFSSINLPNFMLGRVAQSVGHLTRKSGVLGSIPGLATYFRFSFRFFKKGSCQLLAKVCARSTG